MVSAAYPVLDQYTGIIRPPWPTSGNQRPENQFYSATEAQSKALKSVANALKGSVVDQKQFDNDLSEADLVNIAGAKIVLSYDSLNYMKENYDKLKIKVKQLDQFNGLNFTKILHEVLKSEKIIIKDDDLILVDKEYLANFSNFTRFSKR